MRIRTCALVLAAAATLYAQAAGESQAENDLRNYFTAAQEDRAAMLRQLLEPQSVATFVSLTRARRLVEEERVKATLEKIERGRGDEEMATPGGGGGSTAIASLAGVADTISLALESGGFTQTTSGTVSTIRIKPIAIYDVFGKRDALPCKQFRVLISANDGCSTLTDRIFKGFSASVSTDTAAQSTVDAQPEAAANKAGKTTSVAATNGEVLNFLTRRRAVTAWSVRYELYTKRDARNAHYMRAWRTALQNTSVSGAGNSLGLATNAIKDLEQKPDYKVWQAQAGPALEAARALGWPELLVVWREQVSRWERLESVKTPVLAAFETARSSFIAAENTALDAELNKPIVSFEYTNLRPLNQPDTSNFKLLVSKPFGVANITQNGGQEGMFTFNVGANLYNTIPQGAKVGHLRDVQAAIQWDIPVGAIAGKNAAVFTLAGYYQYQIENGLIKIGAGDLAPNTGIQLPSDAKTLLTPKGGMFVGQAKLSFKVADGKAKVPIALTWSNRTELIKAPEVRGHIGIQFDWDSLLGK